MIPLFDQIIHINNFEEWDAAITANHGKMVMIMAHDEKVLYYGMAKRIANRHSISTAWSLSYGRGSYYIDPDKPMDPSQPLSDPSLYNVRRTKEQFISLLQQHYPDHFEMLLFHPELLP